MTLDLGVRARRNEIVAVLDGLTVTVDGKPVTIKATPEQPLNPDRWQAWPVWLNAVPFTSCLSETSWVVVLTLPAADQMSTIDAADALSSVVAGALQQCSKVTAVRPGRMNVGYAGQPGATDDMSVPVLQFEITI